MSAVVAIAFIGFEIIFVKRLYIMIKKISREEERYYRSLVIEYEIRNPYYSYSTILYIDSKLPERDDVISIEDLTNLAIVINTMSIEEIINNWRGT